MEIERALDSGRFRYVVGIDEVGRGSWAGPLCVGAVAYHLCELVEFGMKVQSIRRGDQGNLTRDEAKLQKVNDSKLLSAIMRESLAGPIETMSAGWGLGYVQPCEIDALGMNKSLELATTRALSSLGGIAEEAIFLVDGQVDFSHRENVMTLVKGDRRSFAVASASIIAKVHRDRYMSEQSEHFPWYQFDSNKGYPSPVHVSALYAVGLSEIHRKSWSYVGRLPWSI